MANPDIGLCIVNDGASYAQALRCVESNDRLQVVPYVRRLLLRKALRTLATNEAVKQFRDFGATATQRDIDAAVAYVLDHIRAAQADEKRAQKGKA